MVGQLRDEAGTPDALTIGRRIRHLRTSHGLTLDALGNASV